MLHRLLPDLFNCNDTTLTKRIEGGSARGGAPRQIAGDAHGQSVLAGGQVAEGARDADGAITCSFLPEEQRPDHGAAAAAGGGDDVAAGAGRLLRQQNARGLARRDVHLL